MKNQLQTIGTLLLLSLAVACGDDDANSNNGGTTNNATTNNATTGNNTTANNVTTGNNTSTSGNNTSTTGNNTTTELPFVYLEPRDATVLNLNRTEIPLGWEGGAPPYTVEFGTSEGDLTEVGEIMSTMFVLNVDDRSITAGNTYAWRVTSGAGTADEEVGPVWTFETVALDLTACADVATVTQGQRTFGTFQVGETCWLDGNLTVGLESGGRTVNDEQIERICPAAGCDESAYYTGWELYQFYSTDPGDLSEAMPAICPEGWVLPTQAQITELETTLTSSELAGFFPLQSSRAPAREPVEECIVTGEFELCTTFLDPEGTDNTAQLWIDGMPTESGLQFVTVENSGGTWASSVGRKHPSHGLNVRCVQANSTM